MKTWAASQSLEWMGTLARSTYFRAFMLLFLFLFSFLLPASPNLAQAKELDLIQEGSYAISSSLLQSILAKEMCSCVFVSRLGGPHSSLQIRADKCLQRSQLPLSPRLIGKLLNEEINSRASSIGVTPKLLGAVLGLFQGRSALAVFEGEKRGCRLLTDAELRARR